MVGAPGPGDRPHARTRSSRGTATHWPLDDNNQEASGDGIAARLKQLEQGPRLPAVAEIERSLGVDDASGQQVADLFLDWDDARALAARAAIGAHSREHAILSNEPPEAQFDDLALARRELSEQLARDVDLLAYPNGTAADFTSVTEEAAQRAGLPRCAHHDRRLERSPVPAVRDATTGDAPRDGRAHLPSADQARHRRRAAAPQTCRMTADVAVVVPAYQAEDTIGGALASVAAQSVQPSGGRRGRRLLDRRDRGGRPDLVGDAPARRRATRAERWPGSGCATRASPLDGSVARVPRRRRSLAAPPPRALRRVATPDGRRRLGSGHHVGGWRGPRCDRPPRVAVPRGEALAFDLERIIRYHSFGMHALVPRTVFTAVGGFDEALDGVEDWDLWIRIAQRGVPMHQTDVRTFIYRRHETSLSHETIASPPSRVRSSTGSSALATPTHPRCGRPSATRVRMIAYNQASSRTRARRLRRRSSQRACTRSAAHGAWPRGPPRSRPCRVRLPRLQALADLRR